VNTGWTGGPYGVGSRMGLPHTRAMITALLSGALDKTQYTPHPAFRVLVPQTCPDVPPELLDPRQTWKDPAAYDAKAAELARRFADNFEKHTTAPAAVKAAGPKV
jgi:phosphoenolpyruvate carboxykinase (ATP)